MEKGLEILEWKKDLRREMEFETVLVNKVAKEGVKVDRVYQPYMKEWSEWLFFLGKEQILPHMSSGTAGGDL